MARFWIDKPYGDDVVETAGPGRMVHLEQRLATAGHLPELAAKTRSEVPEPTRGGLQYDEI